MNKIISIWLGFLLFFNAVTTHAFTVTNAGVRGWARDTLVFDVNYNGCGASAGNIDKAIDLAAEMWNSVSTSRLKIKRGASVSNSSASLVGGNFGSNPIIACSTDFENETQYSANVAIGVGANAYSDGVIDKGYIILNANSGATAAISNYSQTVLADTIAHEMGHVLGFGHSGVEAAVMYYSGSNRQELRLHRDDADALTMLYPRHEVGGGSQMFGCGTLKGPTGTSLNGLEKNRHSTKGSSEFLWWMTVLTISFLVFRLLIARFSLKENHFIKLPLV